MPAWLFWQNIVFVLLFNLLMFLSISKTEPTSGPYRAMMVSAKQCEAPARPFMKDPPMAIETMLYNTSTAILLNSNVTISKDTKNVKFRMKSAVWENNKWRVNYLMNDIGCHGMLLHLICTATGVKYDRKNCMFLKGQYYLKNVDVNAFQHLWASTMEYGRMLWKVEIFNPQLGSFYCNEYIVINEPA